jgi:hypothetical protein
MNEIATLIHLTSELYRKPKIPFPDINDTDIGKLLNVAAQNNMLYYIASKLLCEYYEELGQYKKVVERIVHFGDIALSHIHEALNWMNDSFRKSNYSKYLIIKSYFNYPRLPHDIDVFVEDFNAVAKIFISNGAKLLVFETPFDAAFGKGSIRFHLQGKMAWAGGVDIMDHDVFWRNPRMVSCYGVSMKIPNIDADFIINVTHIIFETFYINLPTLLYLFKIGNDIDLKLVLAQAKKYKWIKSFFRVLEVMNDIHYLVYDEPYTLYGKIKGKRMLNNYHLPEFPRSFSRGDVIHSFVEKRLFTKLLTHDLVMNIKGIMRMLLVGDKFHEPEFISIPEQDILTRLKKYE